MQSEMDYDFKDITEILEKYKSNLDALPEAKLIDLAARLKPVAKHCETIDTYVKDMVKDRLNRSPGSRKGNLFQAILKLVPYSRLMQKELKEAHPRIAANFTDEGTEPRITYELR